MLQKFIVTLLFFYSFTFFAQKVNLDKFQYIIVPDKFDFLKEKDQYNTSGLTKFLFQKKGFKVFLSGESLPEELRKNRCLGLNGNVIDESSMLTIKNFIEVKDCDGKVVYKSAIGKSKLKEYKKGYQQAIRKAFETMSDFEYSYNKEANTNVEKVINDGDLPVKTKNEVVQKVIETKLVESSTKNKAYKEIEVLYAQKNSTGFQLINTKPEIVFQILKTELADVYILKGKNGILYKKEGNWFVQYYEVGKLLTKKYNVKF